MEKFNQAVKEKNREEAEAIPWAKENGFKVDISAAYSKGVKYQRGTKYVWPIYGGWQTADLINGSFTNHQPIKGRSIMDTLKAVMKMQKPSS